ncbi:MAG: DUF3237 family protein, partial [Polyangiaceae bacterium]
MTASATEAPPLEPRLIYYFSLEAKLKLLQTQTSTEMPGGLRRHVLYADPSRVWRRTGERFNNTEFEGFSSEGKVLSGGDWMLIRSDGVALFDARVTLRGGEGFLVDALFSGAWDLQNAVKEKTPNEGLYDHFKRGVGPDDTDPPITLSVRFDVAGSPSNNPGDDRHWLEKSRYAEQAKQFKNYQRLVRGVFVGVGRLRLKQGQSWPLDSITFDVHEVRSGGAT